MLLRSDLAQSARHSVIGSMIRNTSQIRRSPGSGAENDRGDPIALCFAVAAIFAAFCWVRLGIPSKFYFDEVHYIPAAREMLAMGQFTNREHPLLGKAILALGLELFGDNPTGWRIFPLIAGVITIFAAMRAMWLASLSRFATLAFGLLLFSGFHLFLASRIAMLDIFYIAGLTVAAWQFAAAIREPERGRVRLALCGIALGLAMGSKWNALPIAMLPGLVFLVMRARAGRRRLLLSKRGGPVPGVSLIEAAVWLGMVPLLVYALTFAPGFFFARDAIPFSPMGLIEHHRLILDLQTEVLRPHPYQSVWSDWLINRRGIWYLYEVANGAQRGILLIGNPLTMLLGIPALIWCVWAGLGRPKGRGLTVAPSIGEKAPMAIAVLYAVSLGFWIVAQKPVQFYYHYAFASIVLLAALALALNDVWQRGHRLWALVPLLSSIAIFAYFYPILSAAQLDGEMAFLRYAWLQGWR